MRKLVILYTSALGTGFIPWASGTWASALAALLYLPMAGWNRWPSDGGEPWWFALVILVVAVLGIPASTYAEGVHGDKDPHAVTIDEVAGFFVSMFLLPAHWGWIVAAFFLFRLFDVWKPEPIRGLQRLPGGWGIMIDDLLAGVYTCVALHIANQVLIRL